MEQGESFMRMKVIVITLGLPLISFVALLSARPDAGGISGKVTYEGTPARPKAIDMSKEPNYDRNGGDRTWQQP
jgi:hypothetical protein